MKKNNIKQYIPATGYLFYVLLFAISSCTTDIRDNDYYSDEYIDNSQVAIIHPNPNTGLDYTPEELAELTYNPSEKESYLEGQTVILTLESVNKPSEVNIVGQDQSLIETITEFSMVDNKYHAKTLEKSLENLGLMQPGDNNKLIFKITYPDGPPASIAFEVKRITDEIANPYVFLKKSTGETIGLSTDESVTSNVGDPLYGTVIMFDGVDDKVKIIDTPDLAFRDTGDFSVGIWVNTTSTNDDPSIIGDKDWGSGSNPGFVFAYTGGTWKLNAGDGSNRIDINGIGPINDGEWHFLLVSFDRDGNAVAYQDGNEVGSKDMSALGNMDSGLPIHLGQDGTGNYSYGLWYEGMLGRTYVFDYALTAQEASDFYGSKKPTGAQLRQQGGTITSIATTTAGGVSSVKEGNKVVYDFDGTDDLVTWEDPSDLDFRHTEDFTIAVWVNTTSTNDDPSIISDKDWNSGGNPGFIFAYTGGTWKLNAGDGSNRIDINGLGPINDGEWHLLAVSFDRDGNAVAYQDGIEVGSKDMSAIGDMSSGHPIRLAQDGTGNYSYGYWFEGKVANSMIFDYALEAGEIAALFNE
ncbi:LamG domain-containing protein [Aestuariivivens insulae]|uniref:LamG domain-containing protein n=1 Tax=Aestuariivivens insulae TaxID=1621988 RepID=UPI001F565A54|nr:LamG domain-containing protein [Aestuariivivens insulae]